MPRSAIYHSHNVEVSGGVDKHRRQWKKKKGKYLFSEFALAKVFRARFLAALKSAGLPIPKNVLQKWVVDCEHVGKGITALKYLSQYLYRGVISKLYQNQDSLFLSAKAAVHSKRRGQTFMKKVLF